MQVLKKFGVSTLFILFTGLSVYAQSTENCTTETPKQLAKKDPIEFIHNQVLKASSSNPVSDVKVIYSKANLKSNKTIPASKIENAKTAAALKTVNDQAKLALQAKTKEKKVIIQEITVPAGQQYVFEQKATSPVSLTNLITSSSNPSTNRLVSKTAEAPKEEQSFGSSMMDWVKDKYSCMIDVLPNQISNVMLYRFIDDWYGVKYRMGGTSKKGVDCSAFVQNLYKYVFGMDLLRTACLQFNSSEYIKNPADLREGDLVFFRVGTSRISHVGVYLRNNFFVHSASSKGVSIANLNNVYWSKYFAGGGRILRKS